MAAPHVAGLAALLWSAAPNLVGQIDESEALIQEMTRPRINYACGGDTDGHPNNVYGWGIVDALAANLAVSGEVMPEKVWPGEGLTYTFTVSNKSPFAPATGVVLTDVIPFSTTLSRVSGEGTLELGQVMWHWPLLGPRQWVTAQLAVTVGMGIPEGATIVNADYGVRSHETPLLTPGMPIQALIPWRLFLPTTIKR
jgi:uncharacterized repeat protein (TIGR01451 family)